YLARYVGGQADVCADVDAQPDVGPLRGAGAARVDGEQPGSAVDALQNVMEKDRMRLASVRAPEDDDVGLLNLAVGTGSPSGSEHCRQTDDTRRVSSSVAAVDVVGPDHRPHELLSHEVHFVGALRAAEK